MKNIGYILVVLLFMSCQMVRVQTDFEKETNFTNYTTYNYYDDLATGLSELDSKRLIKELDAVMQQKGLLLSEEPDFLINITGGSYQTPRNNSVGVGVGGSGRNIGGGLSVGIPIGKPSVQRELVFDFVDTQKETLFWQAITKSRFKENMIPDERTIKFQELVVKVMSKYPPN